MKNILEVKDLHVSIRRGGPAPDKEILNGVSLSVEQGSIHAIMGPNGSGKSSFSKTLIGHPAYTVTKGSITFAGQDLTKLSLCERAQAGIFLAFQTPFEIEGVTLKDFLFHAYQAKHKKASVTEFEELLVKNLKLLSIPPAFVERSVNVGFSGGEKKRAEILQLAMLKPKVAILDEIDSGLDVDALKTVCKCINTIKRNSELENLTIILITHYPRILHYLSPDIVHVMQNGKITQSGSKELAEQIESEGYQEV